ncbi:MAG: D-glycero-beta-D-manno-heptose 1-phosphate adenylyltransferase [Planctomycetota bacterium]|nr:MAG: D-glycero-beta-D-manno-heptose 1-phosphate adenylyltransferase [Planctomycetota bacterium]
MAKSRKGLASICEALRSQGKRIVFTNGCFDLLHVGHTRSLEDARSRGDYLIVAVNADETVERIKGKGYPIYPAAERMELVAALTCVDYVIEFKEDTADKILQALQPTLYAKGTDYTERTVPERETVKEIGAKIAIVGDKKMHSTSKTIQAIQKRKFEA